MPSLFKVSIGSKTRVIWKKARFSGNNTEQHSSDLW